MELKKLSNKKLINLSDDEIYNLTTDEHKEICRRLYNAALLRRRIALLESTLEGSNRLKIMAPDEFKDPADREALIYIQYAYIHAKTIEDKDFMNTLRKEK
jgi:hypothetical protein